MHNELKTSDQLVAAIMGDPQSAKWTEFVEVFTPILRNFSKKHFQDLDADDLIQETFRVLIEKMPNYRYDPEADSLFRNYLMGILRNKAFEVYRKRKRQSEAVAIWLEARPTRSASRAESEYSAFKQAVMELGMRELLADARYRHAGGNGYCPLLL